MACRRQDLIQALSHLTALGTHCSDAAKDECRTMLTRRQVECLHIIDERQNITFSDLAHTFSLSKPTITEMIDKLSDQGCVVRERSQQDRRVSYIRLTEKGEAAARCEQRGKMQLIYHIEASLTDDEIDLLIALLKKVH
ncbi:MarR family winged helix-turn-helix transcriptional regulator [Pseudoramibacter porci]|nr:MarR family transcriptional regulator [Pseudoramibacter porci]